MWLPEQLHTPSPSPSSPTLSGIGEDNFPNTGQHGVRGNGIERDSCHTHCAAYVWPLFWQCLSNTTVMLSHFCCHSHVGPQSWHIFVIYWSSGSQSFLDCGSLPNFKHSEDPQLMLWSGLASVKLSAESSQALLSYPASLPTLFREHRRKGEMLFKTSLPFLLHTCRSVENAGKAGVCRSPYPWFFSGPWTPV